MGKFITDTFAGELAKRLTAINVATVVGKGLDAAAGDAREALEGKANENGYFDVADALTVKRPKYYERVVGVEQGSPAYASARDMEYGSLDHDRPPLAVFRLYQDTFAADAGENIARVLEALVAP